MIEVEDDRTGLSLETLKRAVQPNGGVTPSDSLCMPNSQLHVDSSRYRKRKVKRIALACLALVSIGSQFSLGCWATDTATQPTSFSFKTTKNILILLDCSRAMNHRSDDGTEFELAKTAVSSVISSVPSEVKCGLRLFGQTYEEEQQGMASCSDSMMRVPIWPAGRDLIRKALPKLKSHGTSCLAYGIAQSLDDIRKLNEPSTLIIITSETDTCGATMSDIWPADFRKTKTTVVVFSTHTFKTDFNHLDLKELATATGGKYYTEHQMELLTKDLSALCD